MVRKQKFVDFVLSAGAETKTEWLNRGIFLRILSGDRDATVRKAVADQCVELDKLAKDEYVIVRQTARQNIGARPHIIVKDFGTYKGNLYFCTYSSTGRYRIKSGCYETDRITAWEIKCERMLDKDTAMKYSKIMKDILKEEL